MAEFPKTSPCTDQNVIALFYNYDIVLRSAYSVVCIATGYGLDGRGVEVQVPTGRRFSPLHVVQTGSGAHPASYPMCTAGHYPGVKRPRCEAHHSAPTSAEVKNSWIYTSTPPYVFMA
jgi:hypothetical protein